jgi:YHS domain-containing protein
VVTGGAGTIPVTHKGKTYYVCCTGCRDAFNDDPEGTIAAYEKQKAESK